MDIVEEIRKASFGKRITLTRLAKCISEKKKRPFSVQSLSGKIKRGTLNITELYVILAELGYDIEIFPKRNK